jgi:hypothetical protein
MFLEEASRQIVALDGRVIGLPQLCFPFRVVRAWSGAGGFLWLHLTVGELSFCEPSSGRAPDWASRTRIALHVLMV